MAKIEFAKEIVWTRVKSSIQPDNTGVIEAKLGVDPDSGHKALLLVDSASSGNAPHSTILLISPSLTEATKSEAMQAAMQKETAIAFKLTDVGFHSMVLVLGSDFSDQALAKVQNSDTQVKKVTLTTLPGLL